VLLVWRWHDGGGGAHGGRLRGQVLPFASHARAAPAADAARHLAGAAEPAAAHPVALVAAAHGDCCVTPGRSLLPRRTEAFTDSLRDVQV